MQFNSFMFILLFLPLTAIGYYLGNKINQVVGKMVIIVASLIFYAYSDWSVLFVLGISIAVNYLFALLIRKTDKWNKIFLIAPVVINVGLLLYFKYFNFAITNMNAFLRQSIL